MSEWDDEVVDGSGLTLLENARTLAAKLELNEAQTGLLVAELRNALVPVYLSKPSLGVRRALALADAVANRHTGG